MLRKEFYTLPMAPKLHNAWVAPEHECHLVEYYGKCCETPCLLALYAFEDQDEEGSFIRYECAVCGRLLYITNRITKLAGEWI